MIGQLTLWRPRLPARSTSWTVTWWTRTGMPGRSEPIFTLAAAAARAAAAAEVHGQAWLVDVDGHTCHVDADGRLDQSSGWAKQAARVIHQRKVPSP